MYRFLWLLIACLFSSPGIASDRPIDKRFSKLDELGVVNKPYNKIRNVQEAFNFIMADQLVRKSITDSIEKGYTSWKVVANPVENEDGVWEVNVVSKSKLPPFTCYYRFDSIGNDKREQPWAGCEYE